MLEYSMQEIAVICYILKFLNKILLSKCQKSCDTGILFKHYLMLQVTICGNLYNCKGKRLANGFTKSATQIYERFCRSLKQQTSDSTEIGLLQQFSTFFETLKNKITISAYIHICIFTIQYKNI